MSKSLYDVLQVAPDATAEEIKTAYRKLARINHPDRGGDTEKCKELNKAYEILGDEKKRQIYDQYGEEGLREGGPAGGADINDLFGGLFGGFGGARKPAGRQRTRNVDFPMKVTLEQLYNSTTKKLKISRKVICRACEGVGGKKDAITVCKGCKGTGMKVITRQLQPGFIQQMQTGCNECGGRGKAVSERDKCKACRGECLVEEKEILEVFVAKGTKTGAKIVFSGKADEAPDCITGDVVVHIQVEEHPVFQRRDSNLFMKKQISLREALTGFVLNIKHLDGRTLVVKSTPGQVYKPGDVYVIHREGMPLEKNPFVCGDLYIIFEIQFPDRLSETDQQQLAAILSSSEKKSVEGRREIPKDSDIQKIFVENENVFETVKMEPADLQRLKSQNEERKEAYEEDEEGQPRAQCRTQ